MEPVKSNLYLAFMNAYSEGISGGDQELLNTILHSKQQFTIVTSELGRQLALQKKLKSNYIITSQEEHFKNPIITYIYRTFIAIAKTINTKPLMLLASSDFIPDVLPCFLIKLIYPKTIWVQKIYHLIPNNRLLSSFFQKISFLLIHQADQIEVDNAELREILISIYKFTPSQIKVVPLFVDYSAIKKQAPSSIHFTAVFFGQIRQSKGVFDLVEVWKKVIKRFPQVQLVFIGGDINQNQKKISRLLTTNIQFLGNLPTLKACSYIKNSDMVLIPSYEEGFGLSVRESLACNRPVIVYDLPALNDICDPNLIRIPLGNTQLYYSAIIKLLTSHGL